MSEIIYIQYLVNELARQNITITNEVYSGIKNLIKTPKGQENYKLFMETRIPNDIKKKKYQGFASTLRNLSEDIPKGLIKDE